MKKSTEEEDRIALAKCREVLKAPCRYGHSDLGDFLAAYLRGEDTLRAFLWYCDVTWLGSTEPWSDEFNESK